MGQPGIAKYIVSATPEFEDLEDAETFISTPTRLNVTDLLPNVTYEFRVQAVALSLDVKNPSLPSGPETVTTSTTGEIPMCNIHTAYLQQIKDVSCSVSLHHSQQGINFRQVGSHP